MDKTTKSTWDFTKPLKTAEKAPYEPAILTGIYMITNRLNGKCYIGQSVNVFQRWSSHYDASTKVWDQLHLYNSIRKYGISNFNFTLLEQCEKAQLNKCEQMWIDKLKPEYNTIKNIRRR